MLKRSNLFLLFVVFALMITSCDDDGEEVIPTQMFRVTIENVFAPKDFSMSGTTDAVGPGGAFSFSFHAGHGQYLSLATMFVQSNDLFYAPSMNGFALYDESGNAVTGDVTALFDLWDAGTEVNEEPGSGPNQAPRQSGPNAGMDESGVVKLITDVNDGFTYPADEDVIKISLAHDGGTQFTVMIENRSDGAAIPTPVAPGSWVVHHADQAPLFEIDQVATTGLENLAEDGNNADLSTSLADNTGYVSPFAPGAYSISMGDNPVFMNGQSASMMLEMLAEDGDPSGFTNSFAVPTGSSSPAPIFPGESYEFTVTAADGDVLSFATMLVQSNDLFVGTERLELFVSGQPRAGDITSNLQLWDAYTEINEFPGAGNAQAPRQNGPNTGQGESGNIGNVNDNFSYPAVNEMIKVTITGI